ncbi:MAG: hypothetical protein A3C55_02735 [Gammaproteobacteria bacterium RIFCSPHIGHO2_02_FULL_42_13]|nr:MAG: hypothetical protein A3C55_02735 [Gammaproteobacteria bacterium RIFCSPHIGHO2_02_FULL_42_13]
MRNYFFQCYFKSLRFAELPKCHNVIYVLAEKFDKRRVRVHWVLAFYIFNWFHFILETFFMQMFYANVYLLKKTVVMFIFI